MTGDIGPFEIDMKYIIEENGLDALDTVWLKEHHRSLAFSMAGAKVSMQQVAEHFGLWEEFRAHIRKKILAEWKLLVDEHGVNALKFNWLQSNKLIKVLRRGERNGVTLKDAIEELDPDGKLKEERSRVSRNGGILWNKTLFEKTAEEIVQRFGCIPPTMFLDVNGYCGFTFQIAKYGPGIEDIRKRMNVQNVNLVDLQGHRWLSIPEVCFSNYCYVRGIIVVKGRRYPEAYSQLYDRAYAIYDNHFMATEAAFVEEEISTEIWGGSSARDEEGRKHYAETRSFKEDFHKNDPTFLGVEYLDCYKENRLREILRPFIGDPAIRYQHPLINVPSVTLSFVDETIQECRELCEKLPIGKQTLPSAEWFARSGRYEDRDRFDWELESYGRLLGRLGQIGYPKVRMALGQVPKQHEKWNKQQCLLGFQDLLTEFNQTASHIKITLQKMENLTVQEQYWCLDARYLDRRWRELFDIKQTVSNIRLMIDTQLDVGDPQ